VDDLKEGMATLTVDELEKARKTDRQGADRIPFASYRKTILETIKDA
jgi:hypothetical protein